MRLKRAEQAPHWSPDSWRACKAAQLPVYPDLAALAEVERSLAGASALVEPAQIAGLKTALAKVAMGEGFLLQGGDCAESFAEFSAQKVRVTSDLLLKMGAMLSSVGGAGVVHLARIAGQFAKPRSSQVETIEGVTLPSYRGDAVNGAAFDAASRAPDPRRLWEAYRQAQATIELLKAGGADSLSPRGVPVYTSHEALLLNYEQSLARFDHLTESWWATSGHMIWIGDRTRALDGAHVEFARGVANPIGLKCGPGLDRDELLRLLDRLDPDNSPGRLVLIGRFGAATAARHLAPLMRLTREEGRNAIWSIDPMHGNTRSAGTLKTRLLSDILSEIGTFFDVAAAEGVHGGGIHLEMTGAAVTECLGGSMPLLEEDLPRRYLTHCDPRLNEAQALDVAAEVARLMARPPRRAQPSN